MARPATRLWFERGLLISALAVMIVVYFYVTNSNLRELVTPHDCFFSQATGLLCPACGGTRAMIYLLKGQILLAIRSNFLAVTTLPLILYGFYFAFRLAFEKRFTSADIYISPFWIWSYFVFVLLFWFVRNIPALVFLRPY